jgi:hypothetical protein
MMMILSWGDGRRAREGRERKNPLAGAERGFFDWSENPRYGEITPTTRTDTIGEPLRAGAVCCR